jgi:ketosteroid isomerase-like protein
MKKSILPISVILLFWFSYCSFGQNVSFSKVDSLAIKKTVHDFEITFNNHDAKAFSDLFLPDGEFTNVVGMFVKGKIEIEEFHRPMFEGKPGYYSLKFRK